MKSGDDEYNSKNSGSTESLYSGSFIQGAAKGRWAEATDGHSLAGGCGIFIDHSGEDQYIAGSFSQGASYYFGLGVFSDISGNDRYDAYSHSQAYAAHYSLACFIDCKGNDMYNQNTIGEKITQIMGGGRDFSAGLFMDKEGDDVYYFGNRSAGIGDLNGIGCLIDGSGDDMYFWLENHVNKLAPSLGKSIGTGQGMSTGIKLFIPKNTSNVGIYHDADGWDKLIKSTDLNEIINNKL